MSIGTCISKVLSHSLCVLMLMSSGNALVTLCYCFGGVWNRNSVHASAVDGLTAIMLKFVLVL